VKASEYPRPCADHWTAFFCPGCGSKRIGCRGKTWVGVAAKAHAPTNKRLAKRIIGLDVLRTDIGFMAAPVSLDNVSLDNTYDTGCRAAWGRSRHRGSGGAALLSTRDDGRPPRWRR